MVLSWCIWVLILLIRFGLMDNFLILRLISIGVVSGFEVSVL